MSRRLTRKEQRAETEERLRRSTARVFGRRAFQAASFDKVGADVGLTRGAMYANVDKEDSE